MQRDERIGSFRNPPITKDTSLDDPTVTANCPTPSGPARYTNTKAKIRRGLERIREGQKGRVVPMMGFPISLEVLTTRIQIGIINYRVS